MARRQVCGKGKFRWNDNGVAAIQGRNLAQHIILQVVRLIKSQYKRKYARR